MGELNLKDALVHLGGSISLYKTLLQGFKDKYSYIDQDIKQNLINRDVEEARLLVHSMKGLSGNLGATDLQRCSKKLEDVIKSYIGIELLEDEIDAILGKEWIMFSRQLQLVNISLNHVLNSSDEDILSVDSSKELVINNVDSINSDNHKLTYNKELLINESKTAIETLVRALNTYNYETINVALKSQDEELFEKCCYERWQLIKQYIKEFEYDLAKDAILEGVLNEE